MLCGVDAWRSILCTWTESRVCSNLITVDMLKFLETGRVVRRGNDYGKSGGEVVTILRCPRDVMVVYISSAPKISIKVYPATFTLLSPRFQNSTMSNKSSTSILHPSSQ